MPTMTFLDAAREVLRDEPKGLKIAEIYERALGRGYIRPTGKTPKNTLRANIYDHAKRRGPEADFVSVGGGKWALSRRKK